MRKGRIYASALARHVHANGQRHQATGRVRDAEMLYDKKFPAGGCLIEPAPNGQLRILSPDESMCINVAASDEGTLFRYA
jgi:hypothetical protein